MLAWYVNVERAKRRWGKVLKHSWRGSTFSFSFLTYLSPD